MLQRIQTVYFLVAFILLILCSFMPMAEIATTTGSVPFNLLGSQVRVNVQGVLTSLSAFTAVLLISSIFGYKNRKKQMKLTVLTIVLLLLLTGLVIFQIMKFRNTYGTDSVNLKLALSFPPISSILTYLGYRGVKHDEELVKSYDRIR